jgi:hypothetical protein
MTAKQEIHTLVDTLPDESPVLAEVRETLRLNRALAEATADIAAGRVYSADAFLKKVEQKWPTKASA